MLNDCVFVLLNERLCVRDLNMFDLTKGSMLNVTPIVDFQTPEIEDLAQHIIVRVMLCIIVVSESHGLSTDLRALVGLTSSGRLV